METPPGTGIVREHKMFPSNFEGHMAPREELSPPEGDSGGPATPTVHSSAAETGGESVLRSPGRKNGCHVHLETPQSQRPRLGSRSRFHLACGCQDPPHSRSQKTKARTRGLRNLLASLSCRNKSNSEPGGGGHPHRAAVTAAPALLRSASAFSPCSEDGGLLPWTQSQVKIVCPSKDSGHLSLSLLSLSRIASSRVPDRAACG